MAGKGQRKKRNDQGKPTPSTSTGESSQGPPPDLSTLTITEDVPSAESAMCPDPGASATPPTHDGAYSGVKRADRGGPGLDGQRIMVVSNFFPVKVAKIKIYRYDVKIDHIKPGKPVSVSGDKAKQNPKVEKTSLSVREKGLNVLVMEEVQKRHFTPKGIVVAFDSVSNAVTNKPIMEEIKQIVKFPISNVKDILGEEIDLSFHVTFTFVKVMDLSTIGQEMEELDRPAREEKAEKFQALEWITSYGSLLKRIPRGRSFYSRNPSKPEIKDLGCGLERRFGIFKSVNPSESGLCMTIDRVANVFLQPMYVDEMARAKWPDFDYNRPMVEWQCKELGKSICKVKISLEYGHTGIRRKVTAEDVGILSADKQTFELDDNGQKQTITVQKFFEQEYKIKLEYPKLPCVIYGTKKRMVPMELCYIVPNQICNSKLSPQQQGQMVKSCAQRPSLRLDAIKHGLEETIDESRHILEAFGVTIGTEAIKAKGRIINPPTLLYSKNGIRAEFDIVGAGGEWKALNQRSEECFQFLKPADVGSNWGLLVLNDDQQQSKQLDYNLVMANFVKPLVIQANRLGINMQEPTTKIRPLTVPFKNQSYLSLKTHLQSIGKQCENLKFLIIIMPQNQSKCLYSVIKYIEDIGAGIPTQCLKRENIFRPHESFLVNVLQKINAKAGGRNVSFKFDKETLAKEGVLNKALPQHFMVIGADVTHPAQADDLELAVSAVVASMDTDCAKWMTKIHVQANVKEKKKTEEMIDKFDYIVVDMVKRYEKNNNALPEALIIYRDGVSEGQFPQVLDKEVNPLEAALRNEFEKRILITCIVTQKRHHTRLFPEKEIHTVGRTGNLRPGTVVDQTICKKDELDFYILSHIGIQGTSRPTHYEVLRDDLYLHVETMQKFTYALCHLYTRCTRSISIPVPVAYADLAAYRGRNWIVGYQAAENGGRKVQDADIPKLNVIFDEVKTADELLFYS